MLFPYYENDLERGIIDKMKALHLIENFWLKVNQLNKVKSWEDTETFTGYQMFTSLTIGGTDEYGNDIVNDLSYMALKAQRDLRMAMPSLCMRYFPGISDTFFNECIETVKLGGGMPAIYNDIVAIPALLNRGVNIEDANNWAIEGCVEMTVPGKWGGRYGASFFNLAKVLEITLHGGKDPRTGICLLKDDKDLSRYKSYEELVDAFKRQIKHYIDLRVIADNLNDSSWERNTPVPYLSLLVKDCVARGKQVHSGGAIYDYTGGQLTGIAMVADCLAALKKIVYEDKIIEGQLLLKVLDDDFTGSEIGTDGEKIRSMLMNCPKYGNDDDYVDDIAKQLFIFYNSVVQNKKNTRYGRGPIGGKFHPSTATVVANVPMGKIVGATPNGRKAFQPLSEGLSPFRGCDKNGPTSLLKTISKMPNVLFSGGQLLNMKLNPLYYKGDVGTKAISDLLKTYFMLGGYHIQINFVDSKTLKDAKKNPENHEDLVVRVAGYSALFVHLDPDVQDDIIERTEHAV
jgi:formate C-acetyltransferase